MLPSPVLFKRNFGAAFLPDTSCVILVGFYFGAASEVDFGQDLLTLVNIEVERGGGPGSEIIAAITTTGWEKPQ
jgi:hypothetical protein